MGTAIVNEPVAERLARVGGIVIGSDRYVAGDGGMLWRLFNLIPVMRSSGADVTRASAERAAGESIWVPTALHPNLGIGWTSLDADAGAVRAGITVDGRYPISLDLELDDEGALTAAAFDRWGDPDQSGAWHSERFGVHVTRMGSRDGVTIPVEGRAGWHFGTSRWDDGEFFRFEITRYELMRPCRRKVKP